MPKDRYLGILVKINFGSFLLKPVISYWHEEKISISTFSGVYLALFSYDIPSVEKVNHMVHL